MKRPEQTRHEMMLCEALEEIPGGIDPALRTRWCNPKGRAERVRGVNPNKGRVTPADRNPHSVKAESQTGASLAGDSYFGKGLVGRGINSDDVIRFRAGDPHSVFSYQNPVGCTSDLDRDGRSYRRIGNLISLIPGFGTLRSAPELCMSVIVNTVSRGITNFGAFKITAWL